MPMLRQACADCGTPTDGTRCESCAVPVRRAAQRRGDARRPGPRQRGLDHEYDRLRPEILVRDGHRCYWCGGPAGTVDHLIPRSRGGGSTRENLVAACGRCNYGRGNREGPPGSGIPYRSKLGPGERSPGGFSPSDLSTRAGVRA